MIDFFLHLLLASGSFCNFESHHCKKKYFVCNVSTECQEISDHQLVYFVSDLLEDY